MGNAFSGLVAQPRDGVSPGRMAAFHAMTWTVRGYPNDAELAISVPISGGVVPGNPFLCLS